ncbi:MAG TPA: restriction endonuclease [Candidatus Lumbricidophila sp.]|nr:restriction endonuclease [Candidatus Lumbricidophila sp.]
MSTKRLVDLATEEAVRHLDQRKNLALSYQQAERQRVAAQQAAEQLERVRARQHPAPEPQPYGVSHEGAESLVAQWMRHLGEGDADTTQYVSDGGIDVASINYIAQVMNYTGTVGVQAVRELAGVAIVDGRKPLFFTSGTFSSGAIEFADQAKIALFEYDAVSGTLQGGNVSGHRFARDGLAAESAQQHSSLVGNEDGGDSR